MGQWGEVILRDGRTISVSTDALVDDGDLDEAEVAETGRELAQAAQAEGVNPDEIVEIHVHARHAFRFGGLFGGGITTRDIPRNRFLEMFSAARRPAVSDSGAGGADGAGGAGGAPVHRDAGASAGVGGADGGVDTSSPDGGAPPPPAPRAAMSPQVAAGLEILQQLPEGVIGPPDSYHIDLTPQPQMTEGSRTYNVYQTRVPESNPPATARLRREHPNGAWQIEGPAGQWLNVPPNFILSTEAPPPPPVASVPNTVDVIDRGRRVPVNRLAQRQFMTEETSGNTVRYEVLATSGTPPTGYRVPVDGRDNPIEGAQWQRLEPSRGPRGAWVNVDEAAPRATAARPRRASGGGVRTMDPI